MVDRVAGATAAAAACGSGRWPQQAGPFGAAAANLQNKQKLSRELVVIVTACDVTVVLVLMCWSQFDTLR